MEKTYKSITELHKDWFHIKDLIRWLKDRGFQASTASVKYWEKKGFIPAPKRAKVKGINYRVYDLMGNDFYKIAALLERRSLKIVRQ